jgi:hypothetical protein
MIDFVDDVLTLVEEFAVDGEAGILSDDNTFGHEVRVL